MEISIGTFKCRADICLLIIIVLWILGGHLLCSCCRVGVGDILNIVGLTANPNSMPAQQTEGFSNFSDDSLYARADAQNYIRTPSTWNVKPAQMPKPFASKKRQRVRPAPQSGGEMPLFGGTNFKQECASVSAHASDTPMTGEVKIDERGGNNTQ